MNANNATSARPVGRHSRIHTGDARNLLAAIPENSVHLILTSPPYHDRKSYGGDTPHPQDMGRSQPYADYLAQMAEVWRLCRRALVPGGKLAFNSANMKVPDAKPPRLEPLHHDLVQAAISAGLVFYDELIWLKKASYTGSISGRPLFGSYPYPGGAKFLNQLWENVAIFHKPGLRPRNHTLEQKAASRLDWDQWRQWTHGVWRIESVADPEHPATFNVELADRLIRLYTFVGETVLDPFAGVGTAVIAAEAAGRIGIGIELHDKYARVAGKRGLRLLQLPLELQTPLINVKEETPPI